MQAILNKLIVAGILFFIIPFYSQTPGGSTKPTLWITQKKSISNEKKIDTSQYFNFNPKYRIAANTSHDYKNILSNRYSLFVVFKSEEKEEMQLATLNFGNQIVKISNKKVEGFKNLDFQKVNSKKGIVLSYFVSQQNGGKKKANLLTLENLKNSITKSSGHDLMELLYYPKVLSPLEKQKVESYLSIKYGISLLGNVDYIDSDNTKIWDSKKNERFKNRITGIGRDNNSGLCQKQSGNAEKNGLYIGYGSIDTINSLNKSAIADKDFLLWGDNAGSTSLQENKNGTGIKKMQRIWKMQRSGQQPDSISTTVLLNKKEMQIGEQTEKKSNDNDLIWLVISSENSGNFDYATASYFSGKNGQIDHPIPVQIDHLFRLKLTT